MGKIPRKLSLTLPSQVPSVKADLVDAGQVACTERHLSAVLVTNSCASGLVVLSRSRCRYGYRILESLLPRPVFPLLCVPRSPRYRPNGRRRPRPSVQATLPKLLQQRWRYIVFGDVLTPLSLTWSAARSNKRHLFGVKVTKCPYLHAHIGCHSDVGFISLAACFPWCPHPSPIVFFRRAWSWERIVGRVGRVFVIAKVIASFWDAAWATWVAGRWLCIAHVSNLMPAWVKHHNTHCHLAANTNILSLVHFLCHSCRFPPFLLMQMLVISPNVQLMHYGHGSDFYFPLIISSLDTFALEEDDRWATVDNPCVFRDNLMPIYFSLLLLWKSFDRLQKSVSFCCLFVSDFLKCIWIII